VGWAEREQKPSDPPALGPPWKTPSMRAWRIPSTHTHYVVNTRSRDVVIIDCPKTGYYVSQPHLQEAQEARPQEAAIASRRLDRAVEPVVRRALHDAGAHEEIGLL